MGPAWSQRTPGRRSFLGAAILTLLSAAVLGRRAAAGDYPAVAGGRYFAVSGGGSAGPACASSPEEAHRTPYPDYESLRPLLKEGDTVLFTDPVHRFRSPVILASGVAYRSGLARFAHRFSI